MERRFHRGFTAAEKTELWDRWKRGESLKAIGRAFGKESSLIYFLVVPHGGFRPAEALDHSAHVLLCEERGDRSILRCCHRPLHLSTTNLKDRFAKM